jgi:hypothetical protein
LSKEEKEVVRKDLEHFMELEKQGKPFNDDD